MNYRIVHKTTYTYANPVFFGNHVAYLTPRSLPHQDCASHELRITPTPANVIQRVDSFGNANTFFTIHEPHNELNIEAHSEVVLEGQPRRGPSTRPPGRQWFERWRPT